MTINDYNKISAQAELKNKDSGKWFSAVTRYKAINPKITQKRHLWQRIVFLVRGVDQNDAMEAARRVALDKEHEYIIRNGETVRWVFQDVEELLEIIDDNIIEGTEVYWQFYEKVDKK